MTIERKSESTKMFCHKAFTIIFMLLCLILGSGCFSTAYFSMSPTFDPGSIDTIAVIAEDQSRKVRSGGALRTVEDVFSTLLIKKGYRIAARRDAQAVEQELMILTDAEILEIGRILRADAVLLVSINDVGRTRQRKSGDVTSMSLSGKTSTRRQTWTEYSSSASITARLINMNREVLGSGSYTGQRTSRSELQIDAAIESASRNLAESFPNRFLLE